MRIKDINGSALNLNKKDLSEIPRKAGYFLKLSRIKAAAAEGRSLVNVRLSDGEIYKNFTASDSEYVTTINFTACRIGCRTFDRATFTRILKAAGVKA